MNLRHLKIFLTVCEEESMTRAAEMLYLAQPTVSQVIADLEKFYGARLFERLNRRLYLTAAGQRLRPYAQHIIHLSEQARQELADLGQKGQVRVGASLTIGTYLLPGLVSALQARGAAYEIFTRVDNTAEIEKLLLNDQVDLGLVEGPVNSPYIISENLRDDSLVLIAGPRSSLANHPQITVQDLNGQAFIVREAGSGTQDLFEHAMQQAGIAWNVSGIYNNIEAIKQAVSANLGLAMVSETAVHGDAQQGKFRVLAVQGLTLKRTFSLIYHQQKFFTPAVQAFREASKALLQAGEQGEARTGAGGQSGGCTG